MMTSSGKIMTYKSISDEVKRNGRTMICELCKLPYTDNISRDATSIICAYCAMGIADAPTPEVVIDPEALINAIINKKLAKYRKSLRLTQDDLARRLGIKRTQYYKIEKNQYIPSLRALNKYRRKLTQAKSLGD